MKTLTSQSNRHNPLSSVQRQSIAALASKAYKHLGVTDAFDDWRREQCIEAIGRRITEACQQDFLQLRAYFQNLAGEPGVAMNTYLHAESEPLRMACYLLRRECAKKGLDLAYAEHICRVKNKCSIAQANLKQVYHLIFTVRNRKPAGSSTPPVSSDLCPF